MPSTSSLVKQLSTAFPAITFQAGQDFTWSPTTKEIFYPSDSHDTARLLHELAHALLEHHRYDRDIQLLTMERDAWEFARAKLAPRYRVTVTEQDIQADLDTYRDWLHARSTCPHCSATGVQSDKNVYRCIACTTSWKVNEARFCQLRRRVIYKKYPL